jgi:di/tricarboxylate transporter
MESMEDLSDAHPVLIILVACILASIFAEIINPTATANIFLPILAVIVR